MERHQVLRLTPSNSSVPRSSAGSPTTAHAGGAEVKLALEKVLGSTATSRAGFDYNAQSRCFAYTAGAAAVVSRLDEEGKVSQCFYQARPSVGHRSPSKTSTLPYAGTRTPESRLRKVKSMRDVSHRYSSPRLFAMDDTTDSSDAKGRASEKVKAAVSLALSGNGRLLAVGEAGYKPRVLLFDLQATNGTQEAMTSIWEHDHGVRCVAFSPDSRSLASLGSDKDGFLHIWDLDERNDSANMRASNRCIELVHQMLWVGTAVVTVGKRHIKVWRCIEELSGTPPPSPSKRRSSTFGLSKPTIPSSITLSGRNCVLGDLRDDVFTCISALDLSTAIVGSTQGSLCLLDVTPGKQALRKLRDVPFAITSLAITEDKQLLVSGDQNRLHYFRIDDLLQNEGGCEPSSVHALGGSTIVATAITSSELVILDDERSIDAYRQPTREDLSAAPQLTWHLDAHRKAVLGVDIVPQPDGQESEYYTWSLDGCVHFWRRDGTSKRQVLVPLEHDPASGIENELRTVRIVAGTRTLLFGDKLGNFTCLDLEQEQPQPQALRSFRAHAGEVTDIAIGGTFAASAGRDRAVQTYLVADATVHHLHSLVNTHTAAVNGLAFAQEGKFLFSFSQDRSIALHQQVMKEEDGIQDWAYLPIKTFNFKAAPAAMTVSNDCSTLIVSAINREVTLHDIASGRQLSCFKAADPEGADAVVLSKLARVTLPSGVNAIVGLASTDKSVRLYSEEGVLLDRDWGHTEGITDMCVLPSTSNSDGLPNAARVVTSAIDGTIFLWDILPQFPFTAAAAASSTRRFGSPVQPNNLTPTSARPTLRKVLSTNEVETYRSILSETPSPFNSPQWDSPSLRGRKARLSLMPTPRLDARSNNATPGHVKSKSEQSPHTANTTPTNDPRLRKPLRPGHLRSAVGKKRRSRSVPRVVSRILEHSPRSSISSASGAEDDTERGAITTTAATTTTTSNNASRDTSPASTARRLCDQLRSYQDHLLTTAAATLTQQHLHELQLELSKTIVALNDLSSRSPDRDSVLPSTKNEGATVTTTMAGPESSLPIETTLSQLSITEGDTRRPSLGIPQPAVTFPRDATPIVSTPTAAVATPTPKATEATTPAASATTTTPTTRTTNTTTTTTTKTSTDRRSSVLPSGRGSLLSLPKKRVPAQ